MENSQSAFAGWPLDPSSRVPLHVQFTNLVLGKIQTGVWEAGERIPSERILMQQANISRATVRQGLHALELNGAIERVHGRGTFVKVSKYEHTLHSAYSFHEQLSALGIHLHDEVLAREAVQATADIASRLQVDIGTPLIHLKRLRYANRTPMMVSVFYIRQELCPGLLYDDFDTSLYRRLREHYNLPILRATDLFESRLPSKEMTQLLKIPRSVPLLFVERLAYTHEDQLLHLGRTTIRGDMYCFRTDLPTRATSLMLKQGDIAQAQP